MKKTCTFYFSVNISKKESELDTHNNNDIIVLYYFKIKLLGRVSGYYSSPILLLAVKCSYLIGPHSQ